METSSLDFSIAIVMKINNSNGTRVSSAFFNQTKIRFSFGFALPTSSTVAVRAATAAN